MNWITKIWRKVIAADARIQQLPVNKAINEAAGKVIDPLVK